METNSLADTGERLVSGADCQNAVEHLHRYAMAINFAKDRDVLDIACGEGYGSNLLAQVARSAVGVDISEETIQHANLKYKRPNLKFVAGAADSIPLASEAVDLVVSFETLEHHDRHEAFLSEIGRVLRPHGMLIMSTPDKHWYSEEPGLINRYHVKELYFAEFRKLMEMHFTNVSFFSQDLLLGSLVMPDSDVPREFSLWSGDLLNIERNEVMPKARFRICFASDMPIEPLGASVFDGRRGLQEIRQYVLHLKGRIEALEKVNRELESSSSHRLGRLLTSPRRWIRRQR